MSILACDRDAVALGIVVGRYWDLDALREHVRECRLCESVRSALAAATGAVGGRAGRGAAKVRGDSDHYRALAKRRNPLRPIESLNEVKA